MIINYLVFVKLELKNIIKPFYKIVFMNFCEIELREWKIGFSLVNIDVFLANIYSYERNYVCYVRNYIC